MKKLKPSGYLFFALHESASTILIHQNVKEALEKVELNYVSIVAPGERIIPKLDEDD